MAPVWTKMNTIIIGVSCLWLASVVAGVDYIGVLVDTSQLRQQAQAQNHPSTPPRSQPVWPNYLQRGLAPPRQGLSPEALDALVNDIVAQYLEPTGEQYSPESVREAVVNLSPEEQSQLVASLAEGIYSPYPYYRNDQ